MVQLVPDLLEVKNEKLGFLFFVRGKKEEDAHQTKNLRMGYLENATSTKSKSNRRRV